MICPGPEPDQSPDLCRRHMNQSLLNYCIALEYLIVWVTRRSVMVDATYLNPFIESVDNIFNDFVHLPIERNMISLVPASFCTEGITLLMGALGDIEGQIILEFDLKTALTIVENIYCGIQFSQADSHVKNALFELTSRITGNAQKKLEQIGLKVELSPVSIFTSGNQIEFTIKDIPVLKLNFRLCDSKANKNNNFSLYLALKVS